MNKKLFVLPIVMLMLLAACQSKVDHAIIDTSKDSFNIGILQIITHAALDAAQEGFKEALLDSPLLQGKELNIIVNNAEGDESSQTTMAKSLVGKCDLLLGISTGSSIALKNARDEAGKKQPLLFTAVTDPVDASLMKSTPPIAD